MMTRSSAPGLLTLDCAARLIDARISRKTDNRHRIDFPRSCPWVDTEMVRSERGFFVNSINVPQRVAYLSQRCIGTHGFDSWWHRVFLSLSCSLELLQSVRHGTLIAPLTRLLQSLNLMVPH